MASDETQNGKNNPTTRGRHLHTSQAHVLNDALAEPKNILTGTRVDTRKGWKLKRYTKLFFEPCDGYTI